MKKISKHAEPEILQNNSAAWNAAYVAAATPEERRRQEKWRHDDIKSALHEETGGYCAYCEGRLEDVSYAHVEHILPKTLFPAQSHTWSNLTRACQRCNGNKGDYFELGFELLNPYVDDVENRLHVRGAIVDWDGTDTRAEVTVKQLRLNRLDLVRSRTERVLSVREALIRWQDASGPVRSVLERGILLDAELGPFSRTVFDLLRIHGFPISS